MNHLDPALFLEGGRKHLAWAC